MNGKFARLLAMAGMAALLAGCGTVLAPAAKPAPVTPTSTAGEVQSGTQTCLFATPDGGGSVFVLAEDTASCAEWSQSLAGDGNYWTPVGTGVNGQAVQDVCTLAVDGMTVIVSDYNDPSSFVAKGVCTSLEADGWEPQA